MKSATSPTSSTPDLAAFKKRIAKRFDTIGLPSDSHELWRYTKPEQFQWELLKQEREIPVSISGGEGKISISKDIPETVLECLDTGDLKDDGISLFQASHIQGTAYIHIGKGVTIKDPVTLTQKWNGSGASLIVVQLDEGASVTIIEQLMHEQAGFIAPRIEFFVGPNASVNFASLQLLGGNVSYFGKHRAFLAHDARAYLMSAALGGNVSRTEYDVVLNEKNAEAYIRGLYIADGSRHIDFHTNQIHHAPHGRSDLLCKGIVRDEARAVYYGFIRVSEDAQKTDAYQKSRNLLLSPDARADAIPNLEIKANDVKCSHGASVGQVNPLEKFYLMTRGLTEKQAELMLVEGFLREVLDHFPVPAIVEEWGALLGTRLLQ